CCGNGFCEPAQGEDCNTCVADCGECETWCGDGACNGDESCETCPPDCGSCGPVCGDGVCDPDVEWCETCPEDCGECPPMDSCQGMCGGGAGSCFCDELCFEYGDCCKDVCAWCPELGGCGTCIPSCTTPWGTAKECGDDGCGGSCGECGPGEECTDDGTCQGGQQGASCSEILQCGTGCGSDWNCIMQCYNQGSPNGQQYYWSLMQCGIQACGLPPSQSCLQQAWVGTCAQQFFACLDN
ncbi:MAG: hypothetical protein FJ098_10305, partial [Deltaproteobacteria bacterium]|nr:hypothetical protein [Deltaproteobacteria bacterium]